MYHTNSTARKLFTLGSATVFVFAVIVRLFVVWLTKVISDHQYRQFYCIYWNWTIPIIKWKRNKPTRKRRRTRDRVRVENVRRRTTEWDKERIMKCGLRNQFVAKATVLLQIGSGAVAVAKWRQQRLSNDLENERINLHFIYIFFLFWSECGKWISHRLFASRKLLYPS